MEKSKSLSRPFLQTIGIMFKGSYYLTKSFEISEEQLIFESKSTVKVGDRALLNFNLPEIKPAIVIATIESVENQKVTAKFEKSSFIVRKLIRHYVANFA